MFLFSRTDAPLYAFPAWPSGFGDQTTLAAYAASQFEYQFNSDTEHLAPKKIPGGDTRHGSFNWAGISGSYFAAIFIPDNPDNLSVVTLHNADRRRPRSQQAERNQARRRPGRSRSAGRVESAERIVRWAEIARRRPSPSPCRQSLARTKICAAW